MKSHPGLLLSAYVVAAALICFAPSPLQAVDRVWSNAAGGVFSAPANWSAGVVPGAADAAVFDLADPGYTVTFTGSPTNSGLRVQDDTVTFDLGGFSYNTTGTAFVGQANGEVGRLTLLDGMLISGVDVTVGSATGADGFLTVSTGASASAVSTLRVGNSGTGTLSIINGGRATSAVGTLGQNATGEGNVNISGVESSWTTTGNLTIGNAGTGSLTVSAAGKLINQGAKVGAQAGSRGTVNLTGFSSSWRVNDILEVGDNGTGSLTVQAGASLSTGSAQVGTGVSGSGAITITGANSIWTNSGDLSVPLQGSGTITIADRATLTTSNVGVSSSGSSFGSLAVTGQGSQLRATGQLSIGILGVGQMAVTDGGLVRGANATLGSGILPEPAIGTLLVSDPGSRFAVTGAIRIGSGGQGHFTISDGGTASATGDVSIGLLTGSNGSLTVTGAGSRLDADRLFVGGTSTTTTGGTGLLAIGPGATASAITSARVIFGSRLTIDQGTLSTGLVDNRGLLVNTDGLIVANSLSNFGTLRLAGSAAHVTASLGNSGLVTGTGEFAGSLFNAVGGEIRVSAGEHLLFSASGNSSQGRTNLLGGTLEFANSLTNADIGTFTGHGTLIFANSLSNGGKMQFSGGPTDIIGNVTFTGGVGGGEMINSGSGNVVTFYGNVAHIGDEIRTSPTNTTVFFGNVTGAGPFTGTGAVRFEGTFSPGLSPAEVSMEGSAELSGDARLVMELGGTVPGDQHDQLEVEGLLSLGGKLEVALLNGFTPRYGDTFDLFEFGALAGRFDTLHLPALDAGLVWDTSALYSTGAITTVPEPAGILLLFAGLACLLWRRRCLTMTCAQNAL